MTFALTFPAPCPYVISIAPRFPSRPAWCTLDDVPARGDRHLALDAGRAAGRNIFAVQLDQAVRDADRAVVLMASGIGCMAAVWWARLSPTPYVDRVAGALFFAPEDDTEPGDLKPFASPTVRLPFPSIIVDGLARRPDPRRVSAMVEGWGSSVADEGRGLRLVSDRGQATTPWRRLQRAILDWTAAVVDREAQAAAALAGRSCQD